MEILIWGFVLFILGVSATFGYDKYKASQIDREAKLKAAAERRAAMIAAGPPKPIPRTRSTKSGPFTENANTQDFLKELSKLQAKLEATPKPKPKVKRTIKPGSVKAGWVKPGDLPQETQYIEELFDDVSINSQITVQELIAKIERMKKR